MSNMPITVPEFIKVRQHLASLLKANSSTQEPTRIRQAENLLSEGVIDVQAILDHLAPAPVETSSVSSVRDAFNRLYLNKGSEDEIPDPVDPISDDVEIPMSNQTPYTPSPDEARERYAQGVSAFSPARPYPEALAEFDRLIAQVRAEAWEEGAEAQWVYIDRLTDDSQNNPYREGQ